MLTVVRLANAIAGLDDPQAVATLGRAVNAGFGLVAVLAFWALMRWRFGAAPALAGAAVLAATPLVAVHAHYLKEDIALTAATTVALLLLHRYAERPTRALAVALGAATGLAVSAKYAGVVLFVVYALLPFAMDGPAGRRWRRDLLVVAGVTAAVAIVVNLPALAGLADFVRGFGYSASEAVEGGLLPVMAWDFWLGFHLRFSLADGMGAALTAAGAAGLLYVVLSWRRAPAGDRVVALFLIVIYLAVELVPLKPWPDFGRYVLPLTPAVLYLGWLIASEIARRLVPARAALPAALAALAALAAPPAVDAARLVHALADDTRLAAAAALDDLPGDALTERFALGRGERIEAAWRLDAAALPANVRYVVVTSFQYERYRFGATLPSADAEARRAADRYERLFGLPFREFAPAYRSYAFSNPTVRIIDLGAAESAQEAPYLAD